MAKETSPSREAPCEHSRYTSAAQRFCVNCGVLAHSDVPASNLEKPCTEGFHQEQIAYDFRHCPKCGQSLGELTPR